MVHCSNNLSRLPPYLFSAINILKKSAYDKKLDVIDLTMGNPDLPTPKHIIERLCETVNEHPRTHRYPQAKGIPKFRKAVAEWYEKRFGVKLNPEHEILALIGSKEGVGHLAMSYLNPGEVTLVTNPGYPVYYNSTILAGGEVYDVPLLKENNYLPDLTKIPNNILKRAKILFLNYPNNPTAAVVEDLNFVLHEGEFVAILGSSGSGKSTLGDLISRFYEVKKVALEIDCIDLKKYKMCSLSAQIGIVT